MMDTKAKLRNEYRKTWETFSLKMKRVQGLDPSGDPAALESAWQEAEEAFAAHKEARNQLAAFLAPDKMMLPMAAIGVKCGHNQRQPVAAA